MIRRPPRSTLFPTRRSSDLVEGSTALIKQMLDIGATTLLVPMVDTAEQARAVVAATRDRKSTRLNSSHSQISYAVFCLKKKKGTLSCARTAGASSAHDSERD